MKVFIPLESLLDPLGHLNHVLKLKYYYQLHVTSPTVRSLDLLSLTKYLGGIFESTILFDSQTSFILSTLGHQNTFGDIGRSL